MTRAWTRVSATVHVRRAAQLGAWDHTGQDSTALRKDSSVQHQSLAHEMHKLQWLFVSSWLVLPFISVESCALASEVQVSEHGSLGTHSHLNRTSKQ